MKFLCIIALLTLTACGFHPVHGNKANTAINSMVLEEIKVEVPTKGRSGQLFRIALEDELHPENLYPTPRYRLIGNLEEIKQPIIIERDARITRYNLILKSNYKLLDIASGETVHSKSSQRISSYNVSDSDFATFIANREARERGIKELARTIAMELASVLPDKNSK